MKKSILEWTKEFWSYLGETQTKWTRVLHIAIAALIIFQIIDSNFMVVAYSPQMVLNIGTWIHIISGITITVVSVLFIFIVLKLRGLRHFYPYLYGDLTQLKLDLKILCSFKLPEASSKGLATIVQGLGLGALVLVLCSGLLWFASWSFQWGIAHEVQDWHKTLTGLIEFYIVGHGCLGVLHFLLRKYFPRFLYH